MSSEHGDERSDPRSADPEGGDTHGGGGFEAEQRAAEGVEHLQRAARELVGAARAFLDVIEDVIDDPDRMRDAAEQVASVVEPVVKATARAADPSRLRRINLD